MKKDNSTETKEELDSLIALIEVCAKAIDTDDDPLRSEVAETLYFIAIPMISRIQEKLRK